MPTEDPGTVLYERAKSFIPGGTQLLSKRPEMFLPGKWPAYYRQAKGCRIQGLDGAWYTDMTIMGVGCCTLGYADDEVNATVKAAVDAGSMCTLNAPQEVELAERLVDMHTWADMVRYARTGGEAMSVAVRIARAVSGKSVVALCGYHGWCDWYLSSNLTSDSNLDDHLLPGLEPLGVPEELAGTSVPFRFNSPEEIHRICEQHGDNLAVIVMEPIRNQAPSPEFIAEIERTLRVTNAVLIVDEITAGFRLRAGGAHLELGLDPDLAVFGKALSNGYPMAAIIGKRAVMEAAQRSFISSTYWTDRIGPAASLATIEKYQREEVHLHLDHVGRSVESGWQAAASASGLSLTISGIKPLIHFDVQCSDPLGAKTFITQEMLKRGYLASNTVYASLAHEETVIADYISAIGDVFLDLASLLESGGLEDALESPRCHSGFQRLN